MAVSFSNVNAISFLKKVGVDPVMVDALIAEQVALKLDASGLKISHGGKHQTVPLSISKLFAVANGVMKPKDMAEIAAAVESKAGVLLGQPTTKELETMAAKKSAMELLPQPKPLKVVPQKPASPLLATAPLHQAGAFPLAEMSSAERVKLRDATLLYQPVFGTGSSSRYFAAAIGPLINVGVRYKEQTLSFRVEGTGLMAMKSDLQSFGLSLTGDAHASMHVKCDKVMMGKVIGAFIVGIGATFSSLPPDANVFAKAGGY